jgi:hypothetical protein
MTAQTIENLFQERDSGTFTSIELPKLSWLPVANWTCATGRPLQRLIMNHTEFVAAHMDIQLDRLHAAFLCFDEAGQGIFRADAGSTPVTDDQLWVCEGHCYLSMS